MGLGWAGDFAVGRGACLDRAAFVQRLEGHEGESHVVREVQRPCGRRVAGVWQAQEHAGQGGCAPMEEDGSTGRGQGSGRQVTKACRPESRRQLFLSGDGVPLPLGSEQKTNRTCLFKTVTRTPRVRDKGRSREASRRCFRDFRERRWWLGAGWRGWLGSGAEGWLPG